MIQPTEYYYQKPQKNTLIDKYINQVIGRLFGHADFLEKIVFKWWEVAGLVHVGASKRQE